MQAGLSNHCVCSNSHIISYCYISNNACAYADFYVVSNRGGFVRVSAFIPHAIIPVKLAVLPNRCVTIHNYASVMPDLQPHVDSIMPHRETKSGSKLVFFALEYPIQKSIIFVVVIFCVSQSLYKFPNQIIVIR